MSHEDIIRAWKDEEYRNSLSEEQRAQLPENPAGMVELPDADMERIAGGVESRTLRIRCSESASKQLLQGVRVLLAGVDHHQDLRKVPV
jgi:mersacidin/lichenicidin family type 2 lantibiotic